jgi:hypothetical protein
MMGRCSLRGFALVDGEDNEPLEMFDLSVRR